MTRREATEEEQSMLTNEQIDRLVEWVVDLVKTLNPLIEDVLKAVKHYFDDMDSETKQTVIDEALQAYQPTISKTETTSCEWCDSGIDTASVMSADMMMRFVKPVNYCPNCGRRLEVEE